MTQDYSKNFYKMNLIIINSYNYHNLPNYFQNNHKYLINLNKFKKNLQTIRYFSLLITSYIKKLLFKIFKL